MMKKTPKILLIFFGSIVAILLIVSLLVSPIAKNYIENHDKELIGRELSIGKLRVNLLAGKAKIKELVLFEDDGATPFVQFEKLESRIRLWDLFSNRLYINKVWLSGLRVNVEQEYKWFNFNSLKEHFDSSEPKRDSTSFSLVFNNINIDHGTLRYADLALGNEFVLHDISLQVPSLDLSDLNTDLGLDLCLADSATLHTDLRLSKNEKSYFIHLKLCNLGIDIIEPYLQQYYPVKLEQGSFATDLEIHGPTEHIMEFELNGDLFLNDLALRDTEGNGLGQIDSIYAKIKHLSISDKDLDLEALHLSGLDLPYFIHADSTSNFDLVMERYRHSDSTEIKPISDSVFIENEPHKSWTVSIADLSVTESRLSLDDARLPEAFHYEISDITLSSKHFTLDGTNAMQMGASLNKVGRLQLNWQGSLAGLENQNLTLMLSNVKVSDFSPYAVQWFGFPLDDGTLSFRSQNIISGGKINGINKLQIASPMVGNKVKAFHPHFPKVPLKFGLYLLTDKHNNVNLDLPISGNIDDPTFSYGKALSKVFSNVLTKVASSPFRLMTDEDNNLKYIPFDPLQFDFTPEQYLMIDNVAATLQSRSDLGIVLEEQVRYEETVKQLCIMQLQRDYYLSQHPEMKEDDLDFITNAAIRAIRLNDRGLCDYAKQYSEKKRLRSAKDVVSVACAVYREKSEKLLPDLMAERNELLSNYLLNVKGLTPEQISITMIDESLMKSFEKSSRYEMHVFKYEDLEDSLDE